MVPVVSTPNKLQVPWQHRCILEFQGTYGRSGSLMGEQNASVPSPFQIGQTNITLRLQNLPIQTPQTTLVMRIHSVGHMHERSTHSQRIIPIPPHIHLPCIYLFPLYPGLHHFRLPNPFPIASLESLLTVSPSIILFQFFSP